MSDHDGDLFRSLLDILWFGGSIEIKLGIRGTQGAAPVIIIDGYIYPVDSPDAQRLIDYAERLRHQQVNAPIEPLPEPS